jgi:hypothetical protein
MHVWEISFLFHFQLSYLMLAKFFRLLFRCLVIHETWAIKIFVGLWRRFKNKNIFDLQTSKWHLQNCLFWATSKNNTTG